MKGYYTSFSYRGWMPCWNRWADFASETEYEEAYNALN